MWIELKVYYGGEDEISLIKSGDEDVVGERAVWINLDQCVGILMSEEFAKLTLSDGQVLKTTSPDDLQKLREYLHWHSRP